MRQSFLIISTVITLGAIIPYLRDILRGTTKPNIVSWITWTMLTGIATAAELAEGAYVTAIFTAASTLETGMVVALGLRYGFVRYSRFDVICQLSAIFGIILWQLYDSALLAIAATIIIDFIGAMPTLRHSWQRPGEETWQTFALGSLGAAFAVLAISVYTPTSLAFPVYLTIINLVTAWIILTRSKTENRVHHRLLT